MREKAELLTAAFTNTVNALSRNERTDEISRLQSIELGRVTRFPHVVPLLHCDPHPFPEGSSTSYARPRESWDRRALYASAASITIAVALMTTSPPIFSQAAAEPQMLHPQLAIRRVVDGFVTPITIAFSAQLTFLCSRRTPASPRVTDGVVQGTVLDLSV